MLLGKEIRKTVLSLTFVAFIIALLVTTISQDVLNFSDEAIASPKQGADYGIQQKEVPELIMPLPSHHFVKNLQQMNILPILSVFTRM